MSDPGAAGRSETVRRKHSHLEICASEDVEHRRGTLLDDVHLIHDSLPEISCAEVDLSAELLGRRVQAPVVIAGMSGGTPEAGRLNRALATAAQKLGLALGVGSQRVMGERPETAETFRVRDLAPDVPLLANLGAVQLRDLGVERAAGLVRAIGADALCVHLNPAQELVQDGGDRDFRGCLAAIADAVQRLPCPLMVKETGCGLGPGALARLHAVGVRWVDVSGAGGTSWTRVESLRGSARQRALGGELREWGIPTAAAVGYAVAAGLYTVASGGIRGAHDGARAIALGAEAVALALPFLRAFARGGEDEVLRTAERFVDGLRALVVLCGARDLDGLRRAPRVIGAELTAWLDAAPGVDRFRRNGQ